MSERAHPSHGRRLIPAITAAAAVLFTSLPLAAQQEYSSKVGGTRGSVSDVMCNANEVMVGVHGTYKAWMDNLGVRCVQVGIDGRWIGSPRNGPSRGGTGGDRNLSIDCPTGRAVTGITGAAGSYIHRIGLQCKTLGAEARTSGSNSSVPAAGATGGTSFPATSCDLGGRPAIGFRAWTGWFVDAIQLGCSYLVPTVPGALTQPAVGGSVTSFRPQFSWRGVTLATRYEVRIGSQTSLVSGNPTSTSWTPTADLPFTGGGSRINWFVRACNANGCSTFAQSHFLFNAPGANYVQTLTNTAAKINDQVYFTITLQRPSEGTTNVQWRVTPENCIEYPAAPTRTLATSRQSVPITNGQRTAEVSVRVKNDGNCRVTGRLETWVRDYTSSSAPYYVTRNFTITW
jgi:hypothetical protein